MRSVNTDRYGYGGFGSVTNLCIGIVKNNADEAQHGRLQIWIPSIDTESYKVEDLPWASYVSPFGGVTANFMAGREQDEVPGATAYGFWAIPKNGAQVLCGFLEGDPMVRFWLGCFYMPEMNRTLPVAVNTDEGPTSELDQTDGVYPQTPIPHMVENLNEAGLGPNDDHYKTRGGYERSVSHPSNKNTNKPRDDGYATNPLEPEKADSQTVSLTTAGRHHMVMSDVAEHCRIRWKTTAGTQILLDDTNERIYISTALGRNWIELDETNGKIYVYSSSKISIHGDNDVNISSEENVNIVAKKRVNIQSEERGVKIQSRMGTQLVSTGGDVKLTASCAIHLKTTGGGNAGGVGESASPGPTESYDGSPMGLIRDHAEDAGTGVSSIFINAASSIEGLAGSAVHWTGGSSVDLLSGGNLNLQGGGTLNLMASTIATTAGGVLGMYAGEVHRANVYSWMDAGGADGAAGAASVSTEDVRSKMIVPEHESWERDEDEGQCPTPRNENYQG